MPSPLLHRRCQHIAPGTPPLNDGQIREHLAHLPGWTVNGGKLIRTFSFKNYFETTAFANAVFFVAHRQDHHPDIELSYNRLTIRYDTHSIGGLSDNDFICAAHVQALEG